MNYKWAQGGEEVKCHYDISFWSHTNYSPLTLGTCPATVNPIRAKHDQTIIRGARALGTSRSAAVFAASGLIGGYTSIFALQQGENEEATAGMM